MRIESLPVAIKRQIPSAPLPINYEAARRALAECVRVDECKDLADRAVAIAAYARQIKDKSMLHAAMRIQARAEEQIGILLKEMRTELTVRELNASLGIDQTLRNRALNITRIPPRERERLIEETPPTSACELAAIGLALKKGPPPVIRLRDDVVNRMNQSLQHLSVEISAAATECGAVNPIRLARHAREMEEKFRGANHQFRANLRVVIEWLDKFEQHFSGSTQ